MGNQVEEFRQFYSFIELHGMDGEPIEFEWNMFPELTSLEILLKIQKSKIETLNLKSLKIESSSCQCSMTSNEQRDEIHNNIFQIPNKIRITRRDSREDTGHSSALEKKNGKGMELSVTPEGKWDSTSTQMVERFKDTGHPAFKSIGALSRGILKKINKRDTVHFNRDSSKTELPNCLFCKSAQYLRSSLKLV